MKTSVTIRIESESEKIVHQEFIVSGEIINRIYSVLIEASFSEPDSFSIKDLLSEN